MPVLTILTGLPGSGKSFYLGKYSPQHWSDFTLPKYRYGKGGLPEVVAELMSGRNVVAEDAYYCIRRHRRKLERWLRSYIDDLEVRWRFFENAPETSLRNIVGDFLRGSRDVQEDYGRVEAFYYLHQVYKVGPGDLLAVHDAYAREEDVEQTSTEIFNELQSLRREKKSRQAINWPEKCRQWFEM